MKLYVNESSSSALAISYLYEIVKDEITISYVKGDQFSLEIGKEASLHSPQSILRHLATRVNKYYGDLIEDKTQIDHWLDFSQNLLNTDGNQVESLLKTLNDSIDTTKEYLVANKLTIADFAIIGALKGTNKFTTKESDYKNISKYLKGLSNGKLFKSNLTPVVKAEGKDYSKEGKFIDLPGAEKGKVVVRFPPEASGYLHVGHAKAALLNQFYQKEFEGKLIFRFDDTNPAKENSEFEEVILDDIKLLGIQPDLFTRTSDHFETLLHLCEKMIKLGKAYADDTDAEQMKKERDTRTESKNRSNTVETNIKLWQEMIAASEVGQKYCIRAKIDMNSLNGCMRDPTIYRCKPEHHVATGNKYKVYPTYDFACPIVDSIENVTHALRTTEYHDRDEQYIWFCEALDIRTPYIYEYSRFNLQNTVLSKRKLTWFVDEKKVTGWNDPRFPTVKGILRRGMTVDALKQFIMTQGSSRTVVQMEWDKFWTINKSIIDAKSPRHSALLKDKTVPVHVVDAKEESKQIPKHPKNVDVGTKTIWYGKNILIDLFDAETLKEGEMVTFMDWGNLVITKINKKNDKIESIEAKLCLDNKDFKNTTKLTWLAQTPNAKFTPVRCSHFDHIISKAVLDKEDNFKHYCTHQTQFDFDVLGDWEMAKLKKGDIIQIQRRGYYICDEEYSVQKNQPCVLFNIPDGSKKESPTSYMSITNQTYFTTIVAQQEAASTVAAETTGKAQKLTKQQTKKEPTQQIKKENSSESTSKATSTTSTSTSSTNAQATTADAKTLFENVKQAGDNVRDLKAKKAPKDQIDKEVKALLASKEEFKKLTGQDWKPDLDISKMSSSGNQETVTSSSDSTNYVEIVLEKIKKVGDNIRVLKSSKASKEDITKEVNVLLEVKAEYKRLTGQDWKPEATASAPVATKQTSQPTATASAPPVSATTVLTTSSSSPTEIVLEKIKTIGDNVRTLKSNKASKDDITKEVNALLEAKAEYKRITGQDWKPDATAVTTTTTKPASQPAAAAPAKKQNEPSKKEKESLAAAEEAQKKTRLCLEAKKEENLSDWYSQLITKSDLIEYYDVSGCYILRPWSYFIWEQIKKKFDKGIRKLGVQNCYFPLFVSKAALEREKDHIEDFAPEVAWVTRSGLSELAEPIAIRPTSETVMYPAYAKWIQSHRDLPLKLNQWNNVVRWEFKHPQPFLRTREFLWQEGHTAFATYKEAEEEVYQILDMYADVYKSLLAVPVIKGRKTEKEKFAGADWTTTIEAYISASGRGIQAATSHHLGQNFSKMFEIVYQDPETKNKAFVYQNSWGLTTRSIGILAMVHGDNVGLVLPPKVACYQIVIIPCGITASLSKDDEKKLIEKCKWYEKILDDADFRVYGDYSDHNTPGWKFNHWELKGVPVRLEVGPKDLSEKKFVTVRRDTSFKQKYDEDKAVESIRKLLDDIHNSLYEKAEKDLKAHTAVEDKWDDLLKRLDEKKIIMAPFCGAKDCEESIKKDSARDAVVEEGAPAMGAKSLCIPLEQPKKITNQKCVHPECKSTAKFYTLFGRSY